jgi:hypothetical protein
MSNIFPLNEDAGADDADSPDPVMGEFFGEKHPERHEQADGANVTGALPHPEDEIPAHDDLPFSWSQLDAAEGAPTPAEAEAAEAAEE